VIGSLPVRGGTHRSRRGGTRWPVVLGILLLLGAAGAAGWYFFLREGAPIRVFQEEHQVPDFSFQLGKVNGASVEGGAPEHELQDAAQGVLEAMDRLYIAGFIDPGKWEDGVFPEALEQFDRAAADQAQADLAYLTLGGEAAQVEFVEPVVGKMDIRFLLDSGREPAAAVATTRFVADGELKEGGAMFVLHDGTYYLRPDGGRWVIVGYDVDGVVQPGKRPTGGPKAAPTAGATP
jgi:hypothetical protein